LICEQWQEGDRFLHESEVVILATGYTRTDPPFLAPLEDRIRRDDEGRLAITRDFRLETDGLAGEIFVQNAGCTPTASTRPIWVSDRTETPPSSTRSPMRRSTNPVAPTRSSASPSTTSWPNAGHTGSSRPRRSRATGLEMVGLSGVFGGDAHSVGWRRSPRPSPVAGGRHLPRTRGRHSRGVPRGTATDQPAETDDGSLVWIWGEVYSVTDEGGKRRSVDPNESAQVCARQYSAHGLDFVSRLDGEFTGCVYEPAADTVSFSPIGSVRGRCTTPAG